MKSGITYTYKYRGCCQNVEIFLNDNLHVFYIVGSILMMSENYAQKRERTRM